jgi:hypothetical protein
MNPPAANHKSRLGPEACEGDCQLWGGLVTDEGYGTLRGRTAHRLAYEWAYGPIPPNLIVHHKCQNKLCINPTHLEAITRPEHARRHWVVSAYRYQGIMERRGYDRRAVRTTNGQTRVVWVRNQHLT